jgi:hypothetical protein
MEPVGNPSFRVSNLRPLQVLAALSVVVVVLATFAPLSVLLGFVGLLTCTLLALASATHFSLKASRPQPRSLEILLRLAHDPEISKIHLEVAEALEQIAQQRDPIYRRLALQRLHSIAEQCSQMATTVIEFPSTESWRVVYEELLRSPGLHLYRSVSYIESVHYWQDGPGQQSTRLNLELQEARVISIERIAIIADHLWPDTSLFPIDPLHAWLDEQHRHGIWIRLVRESELGSESDLLCDFGIYGSRAVGLQVADPAGRTIRFVLNFDFEKLQQAEAQWSRLAVYSISYQDLLDQKH